MHLFPVGKVYDFMKYRVYFIGVSLVISLLAVTMLVSGRAKLGTDFRGGTELEVAFLQPVTPDDIRGAVTGAGFSQPEVIAVEGASGAPHWLIRVEEVSTISEQKQDEIARALCNGDGLAADQCPEAKLSTEVKFSPGGDKITVRFKETADVAWVRQRMSAVGGLALRDGANNPTVQNARENKVEIQLKSKGDQIMDSLRTALPGKVPDQALRVEWIGPKAGAQLRNAAVTSVLISIVFIMVYVAFRFDVRFAPGGIVALLHDALGATGILILLNKEITLSTIAALLTIVGYSINDTVVVYDRVRENLPKMRGATFAHIINVSTSEMLGRTLLTSATVLISLLAFFIWGTGTLKDFALTLVIGIVLGTYSSIYIALPLTEWFDQRLFARFAKPKKKPTRAKKPQPAV